MFPENDKLSKPENPIDLGITGLADNSNVSDYLRLQAACEFSVCGEKVHAFLLQQVSGSRTFVWGWEIRSSHVNDLAENLTSPYEPLAVGLLNIPDYLDWYIHLGDQAISHDLTQLNSDTLLPPR